MKVRYVALFVALVLLPLLLWVGVVMTIGNPPLPDKHTLPHVKLDSPRKTLAPAPKWRAFLAKKIKWKAKESTEISKWMKQVENGRFDWSKLAAVKQFLARYNKPREQLEALLQDQSCPPLTPPKLNVPANQRVVWLSLIKGSKLIALKSLIEAPKAPEQAIGRLLQAMSGIHLFWKQCQANLLSVMIEVAVFDYLRRTLLFVAAHPKLSAKARADVLKTLASMTSTKQNPMPDAFRYELQMQFNALHGMARSKKGPPNGVFPLRFWPFWDAVLTKKWITVLGKAQILRAKKPFAQIWDTFPVEKFFNKRFRSVGRYGFFQYNAIGLILMGIAHPNHTKFVAKWHQHRCMMAATHEALLTSWRALKLPLPAGHSPTKVSHPLTGKPFGFKAPVKAKVCAVVHDKSTVFSAKPLHWATFPTPKESGAAKEPKDPKAPKVPNKTKDPKAPKVPSKR